MYHRNHISCNSQGKSIPIQSWTDPKGPGTPCSRFQENWYTNVGRMPSLRNGRLYPPGNIPGTHLVWRLSRAQDHCVTERII